MAARKRGVSLSHNMFVAFVAVCTVAALVVTAASAYVYERAFLDDEHEQLAGECQTLASLLDSTDNDEEVLAGLSMGSLRATLVAPDGRVLFDSGADAAGLPNHADRPEVSDALATGTGSSERSFPSACRRACSSGRRTRKSKRMSSIARIVPTMDKG